MTFEEYRKTAGVNWSTLKHARRSMLHYKHQRDAVPPTDPTDAMRLGTACHVAMLEPHRLPLEIAVWEGGRRAGKEWEAFREMNARKTIVTAEQYATALAMGEAVRRHPVAGPILGNGGHAEESIAWVDRASGLPCKGRIDWRPARNVIVDLKTAREIGLRAFQSAAWSMGYFHQVAFYRRGLASILGDVERESVTTRIVAVENEAPYDVGVFELDPDGLALADEEIDELLARVAEAERTGKWPGQHEEMRGLRCPAWAFPEGGQTGDYEIVGDDEEAA